MKFPVQQVLLNASALLQDSYTAPTTNTKSFRVISHNLRGAWNGPFYPNEYPWSSMYGNAKYYRRTFNSAQLQQYAKVSNVSASFVCLQEALYQQVVDLVGDLNGGPFKTIPSQYYKYLPPQYGDQIGRTEYLDDVNNPNGLGDQYAGGTWSYVGVGRDDGDKQGESSAILYQPGKWKVIAWRTLWLAANTTGPGSGGGFGRGNRREYTSAIFESRDAEKLRVVVGNTHLDDSYWYQNDDARRQELALISNAMDIYTGRKQLVGLNYNYPLIMGGDFNSDPAAPSIQGFAGTKTQTWPPLTTITNYDLHNHLRWRVPSQAWGPIDAYTTFGTEYYPDNLDYIWCTPWSDDYGKNVYGNPPGFKAYWSITQKTTFGTVDNKDPQTGVLNSDHDLVYVDLDLNYLVS